MKHLSFFLSLVFLCAFFVSGCDLAKPVNKGQGEQAAAPTEEPPQAVAPQLSQVKETTPLPSEDNTETVQAGIGMTGKGNYGTPTANNPMEIVTVPVATLFQMREKAFLLRIQDGMRLFKAEHNRIPSSNEEYMREIIQKNNIAFPQLPPGQKFVYDPKDGELKIQKPRSAP